MKKLLLVLFTVLTSAFAIAGPADSTGGGLLQGVSGLTNTTITNIVSNGSGGGNTIEAFLKQNAGKTIYLQSGRSVVDSSVGWLFRIFVSSTSACGGGMLNGYYYDLGCVTANSPEASPLNFGSGYGPSASGLSMGLRVTHYSIEGVLTTSYMVGSTGCAGSMSSTSTLYVANQDVINSSGITTLKDGGGSVGAAFSYC